MGLKLEGVNQGPFGSLVREKFGVDNSDPEALFSERGQEALRWALKQYRKAGATIGGAPTFRLTDHRVSGHQDWEYDARRQLHLSPTTRDRNRAAVEIAKAVYGTRTPVVGLLAPISDTSGGHDKEWAALGDKQVDWAIQRQTPQMEALSDAGIDAFWCEAFRYRNEAIAVARIARELAAEVLVICFEANGKGFPDPSVEKDCKFMDIKEELQSEAGDDTEVLIGANCTGVSNINGVWERGDRVDVVYPNELDLSPSIKFILSALYEAPEKDEDILVQIKRIENDHRTETENLVQFYRDAFAKGARIAGGCCGTGPGYTWLARKAYNETSKSQ